MKSSEDRKRYRQSIAGKAARRRFKDKRKEKFRSLVNDLKETTPCADCGNFYPAVCMDFDHLDSFVKLSNISQLIKGWISLETLQAEIAKCEIVCANCHRIRTRCRNEDSEDLWDGIESPQNSAA